MTICINSFIKRKRKCHKIPYDTKHNISCNFKNPKSIHLRSFETYWQRLYRGLQVFYVGWMRRGGINQNMGGSHYWNLRVRVLLHLSSFQQHVLASYTLTNYFIKKGRRWVGSRQYYFRQHRDNVVGLKSGHSFVGVEEYLKPPLLI